MFAFCQHEDLWRALVLQMAEGTFTFHLSWRLTYLNCFCRDALARPLKPILISELRTPELPEPTSSFFFCC